MTWAPTASPFATHAALRVLPLPVSGTAAQPDKVCGPSENATTPVGARPVTLAVNVTLCPNVDGFTDEVTTVVEVASTMVVRSSD